MPDTMRIPGEWESHECCWLAFPHSIEEWGHQLARAQDTIAALTRTITEIGGEPVRLLVLGRELAQLAHDRIGASPNVEYVFAEYGDCWVRDTLPLLGHTRDGGLGALEFRFNGWGGKFRIPFDDTIGSWLSRHLDAVRITSDLVLEGGALEFDGSGAFLTTASCVLNDNRNPGLDRASFDRALRERVSLKRLFWLERGLSHDHTDGHVDMLARFVATKEVVCTRGGGSGPDAAVAKSIEEALHAWGLRVHTLPSPGVVRGRDGALLPATYCNFYVANEAVIVPFFGVAADDEAREVLVTLFSGRQVVGLPAGDLLSGGGAFHCVTQPQPAAR